MATKLSARWTLPEIESTLEGKTGYGKIGFGEPRWAHATTWFRRPDDVEIPRHKSARVKSLRNLESFHANREEPKPICLDTTPYETSFSKEKHEEKVRNTIRSIQDRMDAHFAACRIKTAEPRVATDKERAEILGLVKPYKPGIVGLDKPRKL